MFELKRPVSLQGFTFILPSLSVANVPQLAVDLVIESLKMTKIGFSSHPGIVPVIGPPAFAHDQEMTSSCELFVSEQNKVAAMQLRAPVAAKLLQSFLEKLLEFLSGSQPQRVVILGSCFSHERHDVEMKRKFEYVGNQQFCETFSKELEEVVQHQDNKLPWQGFASKLYQTIEEKLNIPIGVLFAFVSEGDNVPDAKDLTLFMNRVLKIFPSSVSPSTLTIPMSWKLLFGNDGPRELF